MSVTQAQYTEAVRAAEPVSYARWRTATCPECGEFVGPQGDQAEGHVVVNGAVVVGCEGYWVVSPAAVGLDAGNWCAWTDDGHEFEECPVHGEVNVMNWGSYSGYAGGRCSWVEYSCGCKDADESNDVRAAL